VPDAVGHSMFKDDVGYSRTGVGGHRCVVVAPEQPGLGVKRESLDPAVDGKIRSVVGFEDSLTLLRPSDVGSHLLVGKCVVAPKCVPDEVQEIQSVPFGADAGVLEVLPGVIALL